MASHEVICEVLSYLTAHKWGPPRSKDEIVNRCGVKSHQQGEAKEAVEELRKDAPFIEDCGNRGIALKTGEFYSLAEYLYHYCGWDAEEIDDRLKHYEGIQDHDWYPNDNDTE